MCRAEQSRPGWEGESPRASRSKPSEEGGKGVSGPDAIEHRVLGPACTA